MFHVFLTDTIYCSLHDLTVITYLSLIHTLMHINLE